MLTNQAAQPKYLQYIADTVEDIENCVKSTACQPILFIGSGLSRRYFSAPSWDELLNHLAKKCPLIQKDYAYYKQTYGSPLLVGEEFATLYREWAWAGGQNQFPAELFGDKVSGQAYVKYRIAEYLRSITPDSLEKVEPLEHAKEIAALQAIRPHAVITTNYDTFIDHVFPEYQPIIGQKILTGEALSIGEIFKIHGCVSKPDSLVFTNTDYVEFTKKKKYLSAKLLTYFSEHPIVFVGYSAGDPNIRAILSDIDEALPTSGGLIANLFFVEWRESIPENEYPAKEKLIAIEDARSVRVRSIETSDFAWVFNTFGSQKALEGVSPKLLRALLSRSYQLVRHDIPRKTVQANFQMLEHAVEDANEFAKLFGITTIADPSTIGANYPYTLTALAKELGYKHWPKIQMIIDKIKSEKGIDIKSFDNKYHYALKYGKSVIHKYSVDAVKLMSSALKGADYTV
jgi:SIR2-like domain